MSFKFVEVFISNDYLSLGHDATQEDLDRYAQNLASHISDKFKINVNVTQKLCDKSYSDDEEITEYLHDLEGGEGWLELI